MNFQILLFSLFGVMHSNGFAYSSGCLLDNLNATLITLAVAKMWEMVRGNPALQR